MNPKRQFRQLRNDDRWIDLPPTTPAATGRPTSRQSDAHHRRRYASTAIAFAIAGIVVVGLWAGLSQLHHPSPAAPSPSTTPTNSRALSPSPSTSKNLSASTPQCDLRILKPTVTSSGASTGNWVELVTINNFGKTCDLYASDIRVGTRAAHGGQESVFELPGGKTTTLAVQALNYCASGQRNIPSTTKRAPLTIWRGPLSNRFGTFPELHCADPSINKM